MRHWLSRLSLAALSCVLAFGAGAATKDAAVSGNFLPPWNPPPAGLQFSVPPFDAIADLHGDIVDPQLVVFFAGNQFMVVHDLMGAFKKEHPQYQRVFVETLPPGILAKQIEGGVLVMGNLRITLKPDVYTAGK
ncbi:MAG: ABC transporter substrate-binding protein, partial [Rhodanobacter sp.]